MVHTQTSTATTRATFGSDSMTSSDSTSSDLLNRIKAQDREAFQLLVLWAGPFVMRWLQPLRLPPADIEDVFQETFLAVYRKIDAFRETRDGSFRVWLKTIAQRRAIDIRRRRSPLTPAEQAAEVAELTTFDDTVHESDTQRSIWIACRATEAQFSPHVWQAFYRTAILSQSTAEVADSLGFSPVMVRKYKSRVLAVLRSELAFWT